jgi:chemosensory pili system protein ChpA (sensor histidine kinase/response regulator)
MDMPGIDPRDGGDLSALAWVNGELRRSLESAHKALRRYLKEAEAASGSDVDAVDPAVLRQARTQIHQGVGALELVGLPAVADVLRASEAAVLRMISRPAMVDAAAVDTIERASFALLDFLSRQLAGKPVSPLLLFPQYRAVQQLAAAERVHPADLWKVDWQWRELPADLTATPRKADDAARSDMETLVLALMRDPGRSALTRMSELCADLCAGAREGVAGTPHLATLWQLGSAVFEAQAAGLLAADVHVKRVASRLMAQLRQCVRGSTDISERLAQDLLFFCSHASAPDQAHPAPRLAAVRRAWNLAALPTADYDTPRLGRFDPAVLVQARKRVAAAKDSWSAVAGGELHRVTTLSEQFSLVGESLQKLFPQGDKLALALQTAVDKTVSANIAPPPTLAMEVATAILYLDASLEDGEFDHPELPGRILRLAQRIDEVRIGAEPQPLDGWMEELYRRVSDRQTMGSVVHELRSSLSEVEKQIDQYFRDPSQRQLLIPVPAQLSAMRGVLSVLGLAQASAAVLHMRDDVDALAQTEVDPQRAIQAGTFDRLADNLGALSFLIDMLSVQPQLAKSLFRYDPDTGSLSAVMGRTERVSAFAAFDETASPPTADAAAPSGFGTLVLSPAPPAEPALPAAPVASLLDDPERTTRIDRQAPAPSAPPIAALSPPPAPAPARTPAMAPPPAPAAASSGLEDDAEMREVFIEEAREVVADAGSALDRLAESAENATDMTAVRRGFHTLKGSSRMVGLSEFGEAAWACEQLFNARLASAPRMDPTLRQFTSEALAYLGDWIEAIAAGEQRGHQPADVARAAEALRAGLAPLAIALPSGLAEPAPSPAPAPAPAPAAPPPPLAASPALKPESEPELPSLLAFDLPSVEAPAAALAPVTASRPLEAALPVAGTAPAFDFDLRLDDEEGPPALGQEALPSTLGERVPHLPSAADLDLGKLGKMPAAPAPVPLPSAVEATAIDLDFDFDAFGSAPSASPPPPAQAPVEAPAQAPELTELPLAAPAQSEPLVDLALDDLDALEGLQPMPEGETTEMDLDLLGDLFKPSTAAASVAPAFALESSPAPAPAPAAVPAPAPTADLDLNFGEPAPVPASLPAPEALRAVGADAGDDEQVRLIGPLRISIPLFNIYLNEADERSRRLSTELAEWAHEHERHPVPEGSIALAHSLAGSSATVGFADLSALARALEHALMRSRSQGPGRPEEPALFIDAADEIRRLLHQFAAGFLRTVDEDLMRRLAAHELLPREPVDAGAPASEDDDLLGLSPPPPPPPPPAVPPPPPATYDRLPEAQVEPAAALPEASLASAPEPAEVFDEVDPELFPIFEEEAEELLPQLQSRLREWHGSPSDESAAMACMRTLHTLKGGARLAGATRLGELAHLLESDIESLAARGDALASDIDPLLARADDMSHAFEGLRRSRRAPSLASSPARAAAPAPVAAPRTTAPAVSAVAAVPAQVSAPVPGALAAAVPAPVQAVGPPPPAPVPAAPAAQAPAARAQPSPLVLSAVPGGKQIDWGKFQAEEGTAAGPVERAAASGGAVVRVRAGLLDRLVNQAGEVSITRARIESDVKILQGSLGELTDSLERMRRQLRDIEVQAESQISSRLEAAKAALQSFDPLEMDRFTRFQELTRFMAESVNDVATLQRSLQRTLQSTEDQLAAQARLTRELQDDLLRTRMVEFESLAERLHRTVRLAAKETDKQVRLEIVGGAIEIDRGVLERMVGPFEHLLRNSVAHGVETPAQRTAAGKDATGQISITVSQVGNEVALEFADDGAGFDLQRIRARAIERSLLAPEAQPSDAELAQFVFHPGFSTAQAVTELAGRGVGLDVVRAEVVAMGGRVETHSELGRGTQFRLLLPLTTAVTQVVTLRCGELQIAVPAPLVEIVRRAPTAEVAQAHAEAHYPFAGESVPFFWLGSLMGPQLPGPLVGRTQTVVVVRSAAQRVALHVDEVLGNQEVVVKNVGTQLSRLPGLAGVTLLPSGLVSLIYNPVALAAIYGQAAHERSRQREVAELAVAGAPVVPLAEPELPAAPRSALVMVVDDSLTVRRVTQRLLVREGYRVVTAKDGLDALERLAEERPLIVLSDIEMPRMDGFDLVRNLRADPALASLPVVMISSRIAQKHRDYAAELGVQHYLGKPYSEEELLSLVARYAGADIPA